MTTRRQRGVFHESAQAHQASNSCLAKETHKDNDPSLKKACVFFPLHRSLPAFLHFSHVPSGCVCVSQRANECHRRATAAAFQQHEPAPRAPAQLRDRPRAFGNCSTAHFTPPSATISRTILTHHRARVSRPGQLTESPASRHCRKHPVPASPRHHPFAFPPIFHLTSFFHISLPKTIHSPLDAARTRGQAPQCRACCCFRQPQCPHRARSCTPSLRHCSSNAPPSS